jgi:2-hydroxy-3-keto-5-methylthiopentenyl-1-phosphate phosphatase
MKKIIVISDFDGTITERDSLVEILDKFASPKWHTIAKLVTSGRMGTKIGLRKEFDPCRVTRREFTAFLNSNIKIDRTFKNFLEYCKKNKLKLLVVSGGFTLNIKTIFHKYGIRNVTYYANIITFQGDKVKLKFPYKDKSCKTCSLCKAPYIRKYKKAGFFTVYIGDSVTDRCPGRVADLVFAKHHLAEYCKAKGIAYIPYDTFGQIQTTLQNTLFKIPNSKTQNPN